MNHGGFSLHCVRSPTCSHEEDPSAQNDVALALVEAAGSDANAAEQEQDGAEDGEDAGGSHHTCKGRQQQSYLPAQCRLS